MKKKVILGCLIISTLLFTACGGSSKESYDRAPAAATEESNYYGGYEEPAMESNSSELSRADQLNDTARKLIKTYNLSAETEVFDEFMTNLEAEINNLGGYIQNMDTYNGSNYSYRSNKSSTLTIRIPVKNLEAFVNYVGNAANITNKNLSVEDVTMAYVDVESRKATYEIEQERLLALLEKAESMEDIISLESRLSEVRYKLESMATQLRTYDNLVDYATVYINVNEVQKYTEPEPEAYSARLVRSFTDSVYNVWEGLKDFLVGFVGAIPGLVILAIVITIIVVIIKALIKANNKKNLKKEAQRLENAAKAQATAQANAMNNKQD